jgi:hypothetical protein
MSPEFCALTAVKLDSAMERVQSPAEVLSTMRKVLEEQDSAQLLASVVEKAKKKKNSNKVHPELTPAGRQSTVSFIID